MTDESNNMLPRTSRANALPWVVLAVVLLIIVVAGVLFRNKLFPGKANTAMEQEASSGYQAVFLTNGQVYFGKLSSTAASYATLKDIYYLQVTTPPIQGSQEGQAQQQAQQQQQLSSIRW